MISFYICRDGSIKWNVVQIHFTLFFFSHFDYIYVVITAQIWYHLAYSYGRTGSVPNTDVYLYAHHTIIFLFHPLQTLKHYSYPNSEWYYIALNQKWQIVNAHQIFFFSHWIHTFCIICRTTNETRKCIKKKLPIKPLNLNHKIHNLLSSFKEPPLLSHCKFIFIVLWRLNVRHVVNVFFSTLQIA